MNAGRSLIRFWVYVLPIPLFTTMLFMWHSWSKSITFSAFVCLLPVFYGYVAPGIATNILIKWRFKGTWLIGNYYIHHGIMYSANMTPLLYISFLGTPIDSLSLGVIFRVLLCTAVLNAFFSWLHDILLVKYDMVEIYNQPAAEGKSPEEIVTHYAPICFFLIGLTYAGSCLFAYHLFLVLHDLSFRSVVWVSLAGIAAMFSLPSLAYHWLEEN